MPKIIENVREQLLEEAKKQISEYGYANTTIRSVANACGLGIGTVYNYFKSKEILVATFVLEEWKHYISKMQQLPQSDTYELFKGIYNFLIDFARENEKLFSDTDAVKLISNGSSERHKMLREQIASFVFPVCNDKFTSEFISESLICWSMENADFEIVYPLLLKIIKK